MPEIILEEITMPEAAFLNLDTPAPAESLPLAPINKVWAKVGLMGHTTIYGLVTVVNVGSADCPVSMFQVIEPATPDRPRELIEHSDYGWCVLGSKRGMPAREHYIGRQAIYEVQPVTEERVRQEHEYTRYPVAVGKRDQVRLHKIYRDALVGAGLLSPSLWTETHQAVIDACDASTPQASAPIEDDYCLDSDPFARDED